MSAIFSSLLISACNPIPKDSLVSVSFIPSDSNDSDNARIAVIKDGKVINEDHAVKIPRDVDLKSGKSAKTQSSASSVASDNDTEGTVVSQYTIRFVEGTCYIDIPYGSGWIRYKLSDGPCPPGI